MSYIRRKLHEFFIVIENWSIESIDPNGITVKALTASFVYAAMIIARIIASLL